MDVIANIYTYTLRTYNSNPVPLNLYIIIQCTCTCIPYYLIYIITYVFAITTLKIYRYIYVCSYVYIAYTYTYVYILLYTTQPPHTSHTYQLTLVHSFKYPRPSACTNILLNMSLYSSIPVPAVNPFYSNIQILLFQMRIMKG